MQWHEADFEYNAVSVQVCAQTSIDPVFRSLAFRGLVLKFQQSELNTQSIDLVVESITFEKTIAPHFVILDVAKSLEGVPDLGSLKVLRLWRSPLGSWENSMMCTLLLFGGILQSFLQPPSLRTSYKVFERKL